MDPAAFGDSSTVIGGIAVMLIVIPATLLLGFLLFVSPLMIWLNIRRLRLELHADLAALRQSVERLSGGEAAAVPAAAGEGSPAGAAPAEPPAPQQQGNIGFSCPGCGKFFEGPSTLAGSNYTCPECQVEFHIH